MRKRSAIERFTQRIQVQEDGCWLWPGGKSRYGQFTDEAGRNVAAHRWSYEHHVGPIPEGLEIDHLCRRPRCVRFDHLEPVTGDENKRRAAAAVTHCPANHDYAMTGRIFNGKRTCTVCAVESNRRMKAKLRGPDWKPYTERTHCGKAGHELTPENTVWRPHGGKRYRVCRTCEVQARRDWVAKNRPPKPPRTHCKRNHEYGPDDVQSGGRRLCKTCYRDYHREWARQKRASDLVDTGGHSAA